MPVIPTFIMNLSHYKIWKTINKELKKLYLWLWLNVNRLPLNIDKTKYIIFHPYNKPLKVHITIKINNRAIKEKEYIEHLVIMHPQLEISYFKYILEDLSTYWDLYKLRPFLPLKVLTSLYYSLIYSHIIYAIEVRGSGFKTELNKILTYRKER